MNLRVAPTAAAAPAPAGLPPLLGDGRARAFGALLLLGTGQAAVAAVAALGVRWLVDAPGRPDAAAGAAFAAGTLALVAARLGLDLAIARRAESLGQRYAAAVRSTLLAHLFRLGAHEHPRHRRGHLMTRTIGDLATLRRWIGRGLAPSIVATGSIATMLAALSVAAPALAALAATTIGAAVAVGWRLSHRLEVRLRRERRQRWALAGRVGERLAEPGVVQAHGQAAAELAGLSRRQKRLHDKAIDRAGAAAAMRALPPAALALLLAGTVLLGALEADAMPWTAGKLAGAATLIGLVSMPLRDLAAGAAAWRAWRVTREKLERFLARGAAPAVVPARVPLAAPRGEIALAGVRVEGVLDAVDLVLPARATLAVHGPTGAGKSTLLAACAGLLRTDAGEVRVDGQRLADCDPASVASRVALVSADLPLLRGTVASNLRYRARDASVRDLEDALARAGIADEVLATARGLDAPVREGGRNLPRLVRHRLGLARALAGDPPVLLIDDFDALLAPEGEGDDALAALLAAGRHTIVIVTGSPRWRRRCSWSLRLRDGRLETTAPTALVAAA